MKCIVYLFWRLNQQKVIKVCFIMNNKNNSQSANSGYQDVIAGSLRTQSKLMVFMVHKLIEKRKDGKSYDDQLVMHKSNIKDYIVNRSIMREIYSSKNTRLAMRQENTQTPKSLVALSYKNIKTEPENTKLSRQSKYHFLISKSKNQGKTQEQANNNNTNIAQKIKKNVKNNIFQAKNPFKGQTVENFGLNISQIKGYTKSGYKQTQQSLKLRIESLINQSPQISLPKPEVPIQKQKSNNYKKYKKYKMKDSCNSKKKSLKLSSIVNHDHKEFIQSCQLKNIEHSSSTNTFNNTLQNIANFTQIKMQKMNDCLDIILNSFHCRLNIVSTPEKMSNIYQELCDGVQNKEKIKLKSVNKKYLYYLGAGNNSNLIRSILKKRSWWVQADSIKKANFVWTQSKHHDVLDRMQLFQQNWTSDVIIYEEEEHKQQPNINIRMTDKGSISSSTNEQTYKIKESPHQYIFHQKHHKKYYTVLTEQQSQKRLQKIQTPKVLHNHYEHNYMLGNKNALYYNISMYYQFFNKDLAHIVPITFHLERSSPRSVAEFQKYYNEVKHKNHVWIVKPAQNSNRGNGIEVTTSIGFIKSKLKVQNKLIVQSYIKNLLLYNGRKFDIRVYMLILTIKGRIKCFWYTQGYIRTSSEMFDLDNLNDSFIHLTNDAVQKNSDSYGKYEESNKLSYSQFQRYLQSKYHHSCVSIYQMHDQMKELAKDTINATYCRMSEKKKQFSFELFGLDFIIDSNFKPFLIEVNTNPCLELSSNVLQRLIPRMMENLFRISVDTLFRPNGDYIYSKSESYYIYDESFLQRNKFTLIFDEKFDRNFEWQQRCSKMRGIQWKQGEEQEYQDEGKLIVIDY